MIPGPLGWAVPRGRSLHIRVKREAGRPVVFFRRLRSREHSSHPTRACVPTQLQGAGFALP
eukprot:10438421-Alexandrium_andersonii.AAC.1